MRSFNTVITASLAVLLAIAPTTAVPYSSPPSDDVTVYIRDSSSAYTPSHEMANTIKAREAALPLHKRSKAKVQACYKPNCEDCHEVFEGSFTSNSNCLSATSTSCLIISKLENASVVFWNREGCTNGLFKGPSQSCAKGTNKVGAPGTNSIGVHVGCK